MINKNSKIYIAGHRGMVGSACWKVLKTNGYNNLIGKGSNQVDLRNQEHVKEFIKKEKPDVIINAAAKVGGILANSTYPYEFLMDNMLIQNNLICSAVEFNVSKFIFLGSSCIYPKYSEQPIKEEYLLTGSLEPTNQWYAIAKITGVKLIDALRIQHDRTGYVSLMPTNLYGPNDNYDMQNSHVIPGLIQRIVQAKKEKEHSVEIWGSGKPLRDFLHVYDLATACMIILKQTKPENIYNVGSGTEISIENLAKTIAKIVGFEGELIFNTNYPDGTLKKLLDISKISNLGWEPKIDFHEGLKETIKLYIGK